MTRTTPPYPRDAAARAALIVWARAGAEIMRRCRVDREQAALRNMLCEFSALTLAEYHQYRRIAMSKADAAELRLTIRREIERELSSP